MQAQSNTQQVFTIIATEGLINAADIAQKVGISPKKAYKLSRNLMNRSTPLIRKLHDTNGNVFFSAVVPQAQAVFNQRKAVVAKRSIKQEIYKVLEGVSSLNPTEVTSALTNGASYQTVARTMAKMVEQVILTKDGYQYSVVPGAYSKIYSRKGRPAKA